MLIGALRHGRRFLVVLWVLARYRALFFLKQHDVPLRVRLAIGLITLPVPRKGGLPKDDAQRLAAAFNALGPAYVKLGQMLATRPDIVGDELARGLQGLQDGLPPFSLAAAHQVIAEDLGAPVEELFSSFSDAPVAAASIAQVHKAITTDGQEVAVKVLRPGIRQRFERDLAAFLWAAGLAERLIPKAHRLRPVAAVSTIIDSVRQEMDLRLEAAAAAELAGNMGGEKGYRVPTIDWTRTAQRVMTLEWIDGVPLRDTQRLRADGHDLPQLAQTIVGAFLKQAMRDGFFHADLHQGNLLVEADGTIVALDFGIMGRLDRDSSRFLAEILWGFLEKDFLAVADTHFRAGYVPPNRSREQFAQALRAIAGPIMDRPVQEVSAGGLLAQLFATTEAFDMETQPQLLMLQRTMVMVEGMALYLDPKANMWAISRPTIEAWMTEMLSPEVQLADAILSARDAAIRLPRLASQAAELLESTAKDGVRLSDETIARLTAKSRQSRLSWPAAIVALAAGLAIGLALG